MMAQNVTGKSAKGLLIESGAVLKKIDCLIQEKGRMTVAQTLEVVYGLVSNMKVVMNGTQSLLSWLMTFNRDIMYVGRW
jgi:hypothetical protein